MKYLFDYWEQVKKELGHKYILFFFDYDGTLTPIAQTPQEAKISPEVKGLLKELSCQPHCALAVISGRSLADIKQIVGLKNIIYAGNHGLEIEGPKIKFESPVSLRSKSVIREIYEEMTSKFAQVAGVLVEDKGLAVSVHYRLVAEPALKEFMSIFSAITEPYLAHKKIKIIEGKKVYEVRPTVAWDKGKIVLWLFIRQQFLLGESKVFPVYCGDDLPDEEAFSVLKNKGLTIFVGQPRPSEAAYYIKNSEEITRFIKQFLELRLR